MYVGTGQGPDDAHCAKALRNSWRHYRRLTGSAFAMYGILCEEDKLIGPAAHCNVLSFVLCTLGR